MLRDLNLVRSMYHSKVTVQCIFSQMFTDLINLIFLRHLEVKSPSSLETTNSYLVMSPTQRSVSPFRDQTDRPGQLKCYHGNTTIILFPVEPFPLCLRTKHFLKINIFSIRMSRLVYYDKGIIPDLFSRISCL